MGRLTAWMIGWIGRFISRLIARISRGMTARTDRRARGRRVNASERNGFVSHTRPRKSAHVKEEEVDLVRSYGRCPIKRVANASRRAVDMIKT